MLNLVEWNTFGYDPFFMSFFVVLMIFLLFHHFVEIKKLDIDAVAFAKVGCGSCFVKPYIWLVKFGARVFLSPTCISTAVLPPTYAE